MWAAETARTVFVYACACACARACAFVCAHVNPQGRMHRFGGPRRGAHLVRCSLARCSLARCSRAPLLAPARPRDTTAALSRDRALRTVAARRRAAGSAAAAAASAAPASHPPPGLYPPSAQVAPPAVAPVLAAAAAIAPLCPPLCPPLSPLRLLEARRARLVVPRASSYTSRCHSCCEAARCEAARAAWAARPA